MPAFNGTAGQGHSNTPHIRLNSGAHDLNDATSIYSTDTSGATERTGRLPTSRSLTAGPFRSNNPFLPPATLSRGDSSDRLLPPSPSRSRSRRYRDETPSRSHSANSLDSRRSSYSDASDARRNPRAGPFTTPFDDSRSPSRAGSDEDDGVNTQTVTEKYNIMPSEGLLLFPEDVEKDDYLHNPDPSDKDNVRCAELFSKRGVVNLGALILIIGGILMLFVGYPVLTFVKKATKPQNVTQTCAMDPMCLSMDKPLLKNIRANNIDPATPKSVYTKKSAKGKTLNLVFSDEFEDEGRTFYPGDDPYWTAVNLWYGVTQDIEWYDPDAVNTTGGALTIYFENYKNHGLLYRSGMLQSWNQLCFKGGFMEASISLPGRGDTSGFWPGFWALGNLGRPGYAATTYGTWPYSYDDVCDAGITPNQSDTSGTSYLPGMKLPACTCDGEDHPSPGKSRSAPEIDAIEASIAWLGGNGINGVGSASQSFQVAPFDVYYQPDPQFIQVRDHSISQLNSYQGGPYQQAISGLTNLNNDWYDGNAYQTYSFDYKPGGDGYVAFYVGDDANFYIDGKAVRENGNIAQRLMPEEPMALVSNFGMSPTFAPINYPEIAKILPAKMRFDFIRIYQDDEGELTCDPVGYPTTNYIEKHRKVYDNPNITSWEKAGYSWPKNALMNGCTSSAEPQKSKDRRAKFGI